MKIRTYKDLEKALKKAVQDVMEDEVVEKSVKLGQDNVAKEVYEAYPKPVEYTRTYELMTGFDYKPIKNGIEFYNDRSEGDRYVAEIVEKGHWGSEGYEYTSYYPDGKPKEYMLPRPFMSKTAEQLKDGEFKNAIKKGLEKRGIKTE